MADVSREKGRQMFLPGKTGQVYLMCNSKGRQMYRVLGSGEQVYLVKVGRHS